MNSDINLYRHILLPIGIFVVSTPENKVLHFLSVRYTISVLQAPETL